MVFATEIVDWRRFTHPKQLAFYLGLVSREDSTGDRRRLGSIAHARKGVWIRIPFRARPPMS